MPQVLTFNRPLDGLRRHAANVQRRAKVLWRAHPRETLGAGVFSLVAATAIASTAIAPHGVATRAEATAPAPPPMAIKPIAPDQAVKENAAMPLASGPNPIAAAFQFKGSAVARAQALNCLASAVYYEAGNQDENGRRAVAQVVLNRVRHPAFPSSICGVVYQGSTRPTGCQFTFTCDGSMNRQPTADGWRRATRIAEEALAGAVYSPVGWATHYHADYVVPYWAASMAKNAVVGAHLFYRWNGGWGQPGVFAKANSGQEPSAAALRIAALSAVHVIPNQGGTVATAIKDIPGAEPLKLAPSLRGDKRVAVRFNLEARKASEEAKHEDYSAKFAASDNLKWSLSGETVATDQQAFGKAPATSANGASSQD